MIVNRHNLVRIAGFVSCCFAFIVMLAINMGCAVKGQREVELSLVKDGKPAATIVLAKKASRSAQFAAAELQYHIEKITGTQLPVVTDEEAIKGNRILIGESKATQALGLGNKDFKHQEYLIRFLPDTLILMGRDEEDFGLVDYGDPKTFPASSARGPFGMGFSPAGVYDGNATCYAVYDFLEKYCGVRWYLPTELGLVIPDLKTLSIKGGADARRAPSMVSRDMSCFSDISADLGDESGPLLPERERRLFALRWRMGGELYACNHAFEGYYRRYLKDHPEWFAKGYDKDIAVTNVYDYKTCSLYYPNMCYTSTGFIQQVAASARNYFDKGKTLGGEPAAGDYFGLGPMDSTGTDKMCRCPECRPLWEPTWKNPPCKKWRQYDFFWDDKTSDYIFGFVNEVAKEVGKTHPDKYLTQIAYHQNYYPPTREPLEPNIAVSFCIHAQLRAAPAMDRAVTDLLDTWDEAAPDNPKYLWLYFHRPGTANPFFPGFMARKMVKQMEDYHKRGFRGIFAEPAYISPPLDKDGKAKSGHARRAPNANLLELYLAYKLAYDKTLDGGKLIDEFFTLFYGAAGRAMQNLYEAIERVYCDPANYAFNPDYNGYQTKEIAWGKLGTQERMAEFGKLMKAAKVAAQTDMEKKRVALFEKNIWERMQAGRAEYEKLEKQKSGVHLTGVAGIPGVDLAKAHASVPQAPQSAALKGTGKMKSACAARIIGAVPEGDPDKADWAQTPQSAILGGFGTLAGKPTGRRLEGRLLHDGVFLYVQLQEITDTSKLIVQGDDNIWGEDDWELFVARERGEVYRQIGVNAKGAYKALACGEKGKEWDSGVRVVSIGNADCWVVRMAFPLKNLLPGGVEPGQTIYLNIFRGSGGSAANLSWNPTFTDGFCAPSQMGALRLVEKAGISMEERTEGE